MSNFVQQCTCIVLMVFIGNYVQASEDRQISACKTSEFNTLLNCSCIENALQQARDTGNLQEFDHYQTGIACKLSHQGLDDWVKKSEFYFKGKPFVSENQEETRNFPKCVKHEFIGHMTQQVPLQSMPKELVEAVKKKAKTDGKSMIWINRKAGSYRARAERYNLTGLPKIAISSPSRLRQKWYDTAYSECSGNKMAQLFDANEYDSKLVKLMNNFEHWDNNPNLDTTSIVDARAQFESLATYIESMLSQYSELDILGVSLGSTMQDVYKIYSNPVFLFTSDKLQYLVHERNGEQSINGQEKSLRLHSIMTDKGLLAVLFKNAHEHLLTEQGGKKVLPADIAIFKKQYEDVIESSTPARVKTFSDSMVSTHNVAKPLFFMNNADLNNKKPRYEELVSAEEWEPSFKNNNLSSLVVYANAFNQVTKIRVSRSIKGKLSFDDLTSKLQKKYQPLGDFTVSNKGGNTRILRSPATNRDVNLEVVLGHHTTRDGKSFYTTLSYDLGVNEETYLDASYKILNPKIVTSFKEFIEDKKPSQSADSIKI
ncbi:hypothetical protein NQT74_02660 [Alteromonas stellipolaris]|uniref:hypothetical protein n=1 Tax=Alteromonas stellipolaris TaxID=233316 RepID=UPI0021181D34|nr:hypothetical protein [Alteromonas stellipolaris]MCQ8847474.1 hypothetical protein [Alteromonas stellipolaris]